MESPILVCMTKEKIEKYKNKLEHERILVSNEIKDLEKPLDFGDDIDHFEEDTDKTEEMDSQLAAAKSIKDRLGEINIALGKIQEGKYGICENVARRSKRRYWTLIRNHASVRVAKHRFVVQKVFRKF
jgi:RNA polymerase-binding transcription factor DksA